MPHRFRRLLAAVGTLIFLAFWIWGAIAIADRLPDNFLIQLLFYAVAGVCWGLPLIPLLSWAEQTGYSPPKTLNPPDISMNLNDGVDWGIRLFAARNPTPADHAEIPAGFKTSALGLHSYFLNKYNLEGWRKRIALGPLEEDTDLDYEEGVRWACRLILRREASEEEVVRNAAHMRSPAMLRTYFAGKEFGFLCIEHAHLANTDVFLAFSGPRKVAPPPGMYANFIGAMTRVSFLPPALAYMDGAVEGVPTNHGARLHGLEEWGGSLRSVVEAKDRLVVMELGAGWAPWLVTCGVAARRLGVKDMLLIGLEGSAHHAEFMRQHFVDNDIDPEAHQLLHAVIGTEDGYAYFPDLNDPSGDYGANAVFADHESEAAAQRGALQKVRCLGLAKLLRDTGRVDLIHMDIQGHEREVLEASMPELNTLVRRMVIGTHSRMIDAVLMDLFADNGWVLEHEQAPKTLQTHDGKLLFYIDGEQIWRNDRV